MSCDMYDHHFGFLTVTSPDIESRNEVCSNLLSSSSLDLADQRKGKNKFDQRTKRLIPNSSIPYLQSSQPAVEVAVFSADASVAVTPAPADEVVCTSLAFEPSSLLFTLLAGLSECPRSLFGSM